MLPALLLKIKIANVVRTLQYHLTSVGCRVKKILEQGRECEPFIPDAQTLLTVVQTTELGIPAPNAACLAGAWPKFALRTLPKMTSCTSAGSTFARLSAATGQTQENTSLLVRSIYIRGEKWVPKLPSIAKDPNLVADKDDKVPRNPPIGVRATPTMQTSVQPKIEYQEK